MTIPLIVLGVVVGLIAVRQVGSVRLQIWQIMAAGAVAMLLSGSISAPHALDAIDVDVMLFLFGMFVLGRALEESGALAALSYRLFSRAGSVDALVLAILFGGGLASAVLMNDTVAIVGVPVAVGLARAHRVTPRLTLIALALAVTAGSVLSPIGNPQNLLIALQGADVGNPFITFARWLALPTLGALLLTYAALRLAYRREFHGERLVHVSVQLRDERLARLSMVALGVLLALIAARVALVSAGATFDLRLTVIALVPAALLLVGSPRRVTLVRGIDWPTLAFFAALFIVVESVHEAGVTKEVVMHLGARIASTPWILGVSAVASQVVSNVPLVALALPAIQQAGGGQEALMALAAGSTLAGNLTLIGAASNVIIVDSAERRFGERVSFWEFARVGFPLGIAQLALTWALLTLL
ncbi:MAG: SLC13 family permease [Chloroflexi bacterium]|nr:SLC13 family permease [Chloroflexota bacterium]MDA1240675.1 SLC13 family permease [Chloroflexota bacterium]